MAPHRNTGVDHIATTHKAIWIGWPDVTDTKSDGSFPRGPNQAPVKMSSS